MHSTRPRGDPSGVARRPLHDPRDDWLGDVSDDDWDEGAADRAGARHGTPADRDAPAAEDTGWRDAAEEGEASPADPAGARREVVQRRRLVAGLLAVVVIAAGAVLAVLLLRGDDETPVTSSPETTVTTTMPEETTTTPAPPPPPSSSPTPPSPPSAPAASGFTLPEGTKLGLEEENDPEVVRRLQEALTAAGYDPGSADGTFGPQTEEAVVAFQEDNGLSADGVVGPETAAALNSAVARG